MFLVNVRIVTENIYSSLQALKYHKLCEQNAPEILIPKS